MRKTGKFFVGVDVGGTKIMAALVRKSGKIVARNRRSTPRGRSPEAVVLAILDAVGGLLKEAGVRRRQIRAIGIGVPGVVDVEAGRVVVTPNMNLTGVDLGSYVQERFRVPVALGNDVNLGTLGEKWMGAARYARSAVGIFVGTGIGAGIIIGGKLYRGSREAAGEIGHIVMQVGGPVCGCGNRGCLEALASRTAIERDIRDAVAAGKKTCLTKFAGSRLKVIRSRVLRRALDENDALAKRIVHKAAETIGYACLTVRHLLDPEVIVLGGGVIEACSDYILPTVEQIVRSDALPGARPGGRVVRSVLGDDAVALGAAALALELAGLTPGNKAEDLPKYPMLQGDRVGAIVVDDKMREHDVVLLAGGKVRKRDVARAKRDYGTVHDIGPGELKAVCKGQVDVLILGTGHKGEAGLTAEGEKFLRQKGITFICLPTPAAVQEYNHAIGRKAALMHVTG